METQMTVRFLEHNSGKYTPRTYANANKAHMTIAIAVDFSTAGERCTEKAAGLKYMRIGYTDDIEASIKHIVNVLTKHSATIINIAGNGVYTFQQYGISQIDINARVYEILRRVYLAYPDIKLIVSGGQTGVDFAGAVAANLLNIPAEILLPAGFIQRHADGADVSMPLSQLESDLKRYSDILSGNTSKEDPVSVFDIDRIRRDAIAVYGSLDAFIDALMDNDVGKYEEG
jgi:hypothetical protein